MKRPTDAAEPKYWGSQPQIAWVTGQQQQKPLFNLGPPPGYHDQVETGRRPLGLWRVSGSILRRDDASDIPLATIGWGSGANAQELQNVLFPFVAYIPGSATGTVKPSAPLAGSGLEVCVDVTPVHGYARQRVSTLHAVGLLPPTTVAVQSLDGATTVTPQGAAAPIPLALGARLEISGQCVVNAGSVVAEHEL